jgi:hypothetical protein
VDIETRRKKQQELMIRMVERKVRERAKQLYEERGQVEGQALADWVQAESEILGSTILAPLYRRHKSAVQNPENDNAKLPPELVPDLEPTCQESV